jgi:hypothetical protein
MQCFPYYLTLRMISFHVINCTRIRKISGLLTELSNYEQRFQAASCNSKKGSALMTVAYTSPDYLFSSNTWRQAFWKIHSTVSEERNASNFRVIRYITSLFNRHNISGLIVYGAVHYISQTGAYQFSVFVWLTQATVDMCMYVCTGVLFVTYARMLSVCVISGSPPL